MSPLVLLAASASALATGLLVTDLIPPPRSLASRLQPYLTPTRSMTRSHGGGGPVAQVFGPIVSQVAETVGRLLEKSGDQVTILKLRQAGWYRQLPEEEMVSAYRVTQLRSMVIATGLGLSVGWAIGASMVQRLVLVGLGLLVGATR